jgi:hypothetical protein
LSSSTVKRAVVYRFDRLPFEALVNAGAHVHLTQLELITPEGSLQIIDYLDLKAVCFVSETGRLDLFSEHPLFERRPKVAGLWTRFSFRDGAQLDGMLSHNLLDWPPAGYLITPPRAGATRQRVFIPRAAVMATELRGVVGSSLAAATKRGKATAEPARGQLSMFE